MAKKMEEIKMQEVLVSWTDDMGKVKSATVKVKADIDRWTMVRAVRAELMEKVSGHDLFFHTSDPFIDRFDHSVRVYQYIKGSALSFVGTCAIPIEQKNAAAFISKKYNERKKLGPVFCMEYGPISLKQPYAKETVSIVYTHIPGEKPSRQAVETTRVHRYVALEAAKLAKGTCTLRTSKGKTKSQHTYTLMNSDKEVLCTWEAEELNVLKGFRQPDTLCWGCANAIPNRDGTMGCNWSRFFEPVEGWDTLSAPGDTSLTVLRCPEFEEG